MYLQRLAPVLRCGSLRIWRAPPAPAAGCGGAAPMVKSGPGAPVDVEGVRGAGALKGDEGACPNAGDGAPNPVVAAGSPTVEPAGEAGCEPKANGEVAAGKGAWNENGDA